MMKTKSKFNSGANPPAKKRSGRRHVPSLNLPKPRTDVAGADIGAREIVFCVPEGADLQPVREAVKYRDCVINAFNADQPFKQFLREQISGDILAQAGPSDQYAQRVTATGFLAVGKRYGYKPSPDYQHLDFADAIDSVGRSLLGLSLGCARCHDHKYDPVTAADYYALYGIFQSTRWAFPAARNKNGPRHFLHW